MTKPNIIEEKPISMFDLKEQLDKNKKDMGELNFRAERTSEYLDEFMKIKPKEGKELIEKLIELKIPRLREQHLFKIADLMPHKLELVKLLFQGTPLTISDESCKKIVKIVEEYRK
jgi:DNA-directed RNA polymerase subunit F